MADVGRVENWVMCSSETVRQSLTRSCPSSSRVNFVGRTAVLTPTMTIVGLVTSMVVRSER